MRLLIQESAEAVTNTAYDKVPVGGVAVDTEEGGECSA